MNSCLSAEALERLLDGTLPEEEAMGAYAHLAGCAQCQVVFDRMIEKPEWKQWASVCWPQRAVSGSSHPRHVMEPALARLLEKLQATPAPDASGSADTAEELDVSLSFLGPPLVPGDLGSLGPYRILAELGRGGMGIVLRAYDPELRRTVALKVLPPDRADAKARARFVREAQAAAGLSHENIVPVHAVANPPDGPPYFVMPYVDGPTLRQRIEAEGCLDPHEAARICQQAADGLAAAHAAGVVHRDVKPGNVLLERGTGRAKIMDFGLVRMSTAPWGTTQDGTISGTPEYMSPEQVRQPDHVDARSDVYSLGVTLYEALTGEVPFRGVAHLVLQQVLNEEPRPPRRLNDTIPRDLETICLKCLQKEPGRRYADTAALAEDLRRFLTGEPIQARPVGRAERLWRWGRRNPLVASLVAALFLVLAAGLAGATSQWLRAEAKASAEAQARQEVTDKAQELADKAQELKRRLYYNHIALAEREIFAHNPGRAEELLDECPEGLRGWEWYYLKRLCHATPLTLRLDQRTSWGRGFDLAFSPDGRFLAAPRGEKDIKTWDVSTGQPVLTLRGHQDRVLRVAFRPDGRRLASTSADRTVRVWDTTTGQDVVLLRGHEQPVHGVAFSPDGRHLASASLDHTVKLWDATTGALLHTFPASFPRTIFVTLAFSPDGQFLAAPGVDQAVTVREVSSGREVATLRGHTDQVFSMAFSPDGRRLVTVGWEGAVKCWDLTAGGRGESALRFSVAGQSHAAWSVAFSADGRRLALGGAFADEAAHVYDARTGQDLFALRGHRVRVVSVAFSPDGQLLASGSLDKTVKLWDTETGQEVLTLRGHSNLIGHVLFDPGGRRLASSSEDGTVRVWDATPLEEDPRIRTLRGHAGVVYGLAFSPNGRQLASASGDKTVKVWEVATGREVLSLQHGGPVNSVAFSPNGRRLASASEDKTVKLWDTETGKEVFTFKDFRGGVRCVAFSPDGQRLATTDATENVQVWDASTGREVFPLRGHEAYVKFVAFSHDGKLLATCCVDGTVRLWDATTGREVHRFKHATRVQSMACSPDSGLLASGDADQMVKIWEMATHEELFGLAGHTNYVIAMAFNRDGRRLASASWQEVIVWDASTGQEITRLHELLGTIMGVAFSPDGKCLAACGGYKAKGEIKIWDATLWDKRPPGDPEASAH
jgi:eukaryotic-like serine/threonine-protein kinase